jgi:D-threo-aldose 1-dehydrogenase
MRSVALPRRPGVLLTALGFGAAQGGSLYRVRSEESFAVDAAWDAGIRCFDTAPHSCTYAQLPRWSARSWRWETRAR